jgi:hypothetical protein
VAVTVRLPPITTSRPRTARPGITALIALPLFTVAKIVFAPPNLISSAGTVLRLAIKVEMGAELPRQAFPQCSHSGTLAVPARWPTAHRLDWPERRVLRSRRHAAVRPRAGRGHNCVLISQDTDIPGFFSSPTGAHLAPFTLPSLGRQLLPAVPTESFAKLRSDKNPPAADFA